MITKKYIYVSAAVFAVVALIHLMRALSGWEFQIGPFDIPLTASWVLFVACASLAVWALRSTSAP
ncbi:MAG TPA: hypothetical protein EYN92_07640 [Dehalococcoidia bacterium]|nr:hypothetical protein [Dehalococcoidia bacterium]